MFIPKVIYSARNGLLMALFIPWGTPHNDLYGEAPREGDTFIMLQVYKRVEISLAEVYERVAKASFRSVKRPKRTRLTITLFIFPSKKTYFALQDLISSFTLLLPRNRCKHFRSIDLFYTY